MTARRLLGVAGAAAVAALAAPVATSKAAGTAALSCQTPAPISAAAPGAGFGGVTTSPVQTPALVVPPVTLPASSVGPLTVGPYSVGGLTVPSQTVAGGTSTGAVTVANVVAGAGAIACDAVNSTDPTQPAVITGSISLQLYVEETNPSTGVTAMVSWSRVTAALTSTPATAGVAVAAGAVRDLDSGVPTAGRMDPTTGSISQGVAQYYLSSQVWIDGQPAPPSTGCQSGDTTCSTSATFSIP